MNYGKQLFLAPVNGCKTHLKADELIKKPKTRTA